MPDTKLKKCFLQERPSIVGSDSNISCKPLPHMHETAKR
jgi:hypothetical protein